MLADFFSSIFPSLRPFFDSVIDSLAENGNGLDYR